MMNGFVELEQYMDALIIISWSSVNDRYPGRRQALPKKNPALGCDGSMDESRAVHRISAR
ncbi:hypothetical protein CCP4SC76_2780007 [Gammaproteobacteria bacterium]